jgi:hypothetical protein
MKSSNDTPLFEIEKKAPWVGEAELKVLAAFKFTGGNRYALLFKVFGTLIGVVGLVILFYLRKFIKSLSEGNPFVAENARRLQIIGWLSIGSAIFTVINNLVTHFIIIDAVAIKGIVLHTNWIALIADGFGSAILHLFYGFIVIVIAEVFRLGSIIKEEQDLTV